MDKRQHDIAETARELRAELRALGRWSREGDVWNLWAARGMGLSTAAEYRAHLAGEARAARAELAALGEDPAPRHLEHP
jgi:hypothetical protein